MEIYLSQINLSLEDILHNSFETICDELENNIISSMLLLI